LLEIFDTFGDHHHVQAFPQIDHRPDDAGIGGVTGKILDDGSIDL